MTYPICLLDFVSSGSFLKYGVLQKPWGFPIDYNYFLDAHGNSSLLNPMKSHEIPLNHYELPVKSPLIPMIHMTCETSTSRWQRLLQKRADLQRAARTGLRGRWTATDVACLGCCSVVFPMDPAVPSERKGMFGDVWGCLGMFGV